ncbi:hypothetical protein J5N97_011505 [Dioscorea zingiberensis]|uniref:Uncharacterized protein n=1 Tax=Dioscorea zingiberensis TaxID=325984 RepID=A0A9D5HNF0_9LILI|nr:hypothetical protein J5N97_011505 [Dioscorea zingiberensis]
MWKKKTLLKMEIEKQEQAKCKSNGEDVVIGSEYEPLLVQPEKSSLVLRQNIQDEYRLCVRNKTFIPYLSNLRSFFARGSSDGHVCGGGLSSAPQRREHANNTREPLYVSQGELTNDKDLDDDVALLDDLANVELDIGAMWREVIAWEEGHVDHIADVAVQEKEEANVPCHDVEYVDVDDDMAHPVGDRASGC